MRSYWSLFQTQPHAEDFQAEIEEAEAVEESVKLAILELTRFFR